jgi:hypothetical protein
VFCSPIRCLRSAADTVARIRPQRRSVWRSEPRTSVRARAVSVSAPLSGAPAGSYLLEERLGLHGGQRILWRLSEGVAGDEAP